MVRTALSIKQKDITRALRGVEAAGIEVLRIEIDPHKIVIVTCQHKEEILIDEKPDDLKKLI